MIWPGKQLRLTCIAVNQHSERNQLRIGIVHLSHRTLVLACQLTMCNLAQSFDDLTNMSRMRAIFCWNQVQARMCKKLGRQLGRIVLGIVVSTQRNTPPTQLERS